MSLEYLNQLVKIFDNHTELGTIKESQIKAVLELSEEGGTVPFIARYRKEKTGNLDEVKIRRILFENEQLQLLEKRRSFVLKEIEEQGNLTDELKKRIVEAKDLVEIEEIYRPFKKKKKTKATVAREAGLQPLADWILQIGAGEVKPETTLEIEAKKYIKPAAGIVTYELAIKGAQDIVVEGVSHNSDLRQACKDDFIKNGRLKSSRTKKFAAKSKYEMYAEYEEAVSSLLNPKNTHRYMALRRGWQEGELSVSIEGSADELQKQAESLVIKEHGTLVEEFLKTSAKLALSVYITSSVTNEIHRMLKDMGDEVAINVFSENVRKLLLSSPFGAKCVLGIDPGIRTGCKVALVDNTGRYISDTVLKIQGEKAEEAAVKLLSDVVSKMEIDAIAVGNGTGGREAESFMRKVVKKIGKEIPVVLVNESGASVYSASDIARNEFPELDITVRGAISIARRLQDPLSELVKIDPKSIGVGQYQHDVNQTHLKKSLHGVVESCVNNVGVDLNTASESLLSYVAGIGPALAKNIVSFRQDNGHFETRDDLLKVEKFSSRAFQQSAGFLRIPNASFPLDSTGIHPEQYTAVKDMTKELGVNIGDVVGENAEKLLENRTKWMELVGEYTFNDIVDELKKPGRDPRDPYQVFQFREDIFELKDVKVDMICNGVVTNVTNFGAFVDIGVHQDGLVHISELAHQFVDDPQKLVQPGSQVKVKIIGVDLEKKQLSLSMKLQDKPKAQAKGFKGKPRSGEAGAKSDFKGKGTRPGGRNDRGKNGDRRPGKSAGGKGGKPGSKPGGKGPGRKPGQPFNNPFAALSDINKK